MLNYEDSMNNNGGGSGNARHIYERGEISSLVISHQRCALSFGNDWILFEINPHFAHSDH
jgi:hypothetical protein